jgi:eukaryotic-like serine/threonine-protein kinase
MHPEGTPGRPLHAHGLPQIGQTLNGKYEIIGLLGEGGMAFVYEAKHQRLQQHVAIKMLTPEFARDPELVSRLEREARAVARLRTKHVTRVTDVDTTEGGIPYIVMEFLEGRDLDAELQARGKLPLGEAVDYVLQACAGMVEAHGMGIVHRDLKPANLFVARERDGNDDEHRVVKVLDFGISKVVGEATRLTGAGAVMGTVLYMSPEQVRALPNVDTRADIWSLGVILYELVAGRAPWEGHSHQIAAAIVAQDPPDLRAFAQVPEAFANIVKTMLQRDPSRRPSNVRDVITALYPFAPTGSLGAAIGEQVAIGQSGARSKSAAIQKALSKHTIPMTSRPSVLEQASVTVRASYPPPPSFRATPGPTLAPSSLAPPSSGRRRSRARFVLAFVIVTGLVGAIGVVLIVLATRHRGVTPPASSSEPVPSAHAAALQPSAASASAAAASGPTVLAVPPSTGTAARTPAPDTTGRNTSRKDAGAGKSIPTSPSTAPSFL